MRATVDHKKARNLYAGANDISIAKFKRSAKMLSILFMEDSCSKTWPIRFHNNASRVKRPPENQLKTLAGKPRDQHTIRINDQHRICD